MATIEILIGRRVPDGNFTTPDTFNRVSRVHAKITRNEKGIFIEDLDSSNGTYVNGVRIVSKQVTLHDRISLGGTNHYILNLNDILALMPMSDHEFSRKFQNPKYIYESYQEESNRLQTGGQESMTTKRMGPTMILGALTGIMSAIATDNARAAIGICGGLLTIIVFIFANKWASNSNKQNKERLTRLNEQFELDYVCPACGTSLRGRSWEFLRRAGKCPACQRHFTVD